MLLLLFAGVSEAPPEPEPTIPLGSGWRGLDVFDIERQAMEQAEARDLRDLQEVMAALFAFEGIF